MTKDNKSYEWLKQNDIAIDNKKTMAVNTIRGKLFILSNLIISLELFVATLDNSASLI